ncbi:MULTISPECIES: hypothetical protein [Streptomyces]|uniref:hypothetical protein n=1 Tax=Streptomyces TaxID=1883 RepID=UPI0023DD4D16|nr:hypothetical protein [Streptomyces sp. FXJ1.172]WEP00843.1 hypothetical protein A6P39_042510 [Streptomyces sp. FXJ1.172]
MENAALRTNEGKQRSGSGSRQRQPDAACGDCAGSGYRTQDAPGVLQAVRADQVRRPGRLGAGCVGDGDRDVGGGQRFRVRPGDHQGVQATSGYLPALVTIVGVTVGIRLCRWANARYFHLDRGSCGL